MAQIGPIKTKSMLEEQDAQLANSMDFPVTDESLAAWRAKQNGGTVETTETIPPSSSTGGGGNTSGIVTVRNKETGAISTVYEATPGLFGKIGYEYVDNYIPSPAAQTSAEAAKYTPQIAETFVPDPAILGEEGAATVRKAQSLVFPSSSDEGQGGGGADNTELPSFDNIESPNLDIGRPEEPQGHLVEFSKVLSQIVEASRQKREMFMEKFIPGQIPLGSMSASSFTGIMNKMLSSSSQFSRDLAGSGFKAATNQAELDQKNFELKLTEFNKEKDNIDKVALTLMGEGAPSMVSSAASKAGSLDAAISIASDWLSKHNKDVSLMSVSGGFFILTKNPDGTISKEFVSGPGTGGGGTLPGGGGAGITGAKHIGGSVIELPDGTTIDIMTVEGVKHLASTGAQYANIKAFLLAADDKWDLGQTQSSIEDLLTQAGLEEPSVESGKVHLDPERVTYWAKFIRKTDDVKSEFGNADEYQKARAAVDVYAEEYNWDAASTEAVRNAIPERG